LRNQCTYCSVVLCDVSAEVMPVPISMMRSNFDSNEKKRKWKYRYKKTPEGELQVSARRAVMEKD